jgi:hypothetical protein
MDALKTAYERISQNCCHIKLVLTAFVLKRCRSGFKLRANGPNVAATFLGLPSNFMNVLGREGDLERRNFSKFDGDQYRSAQPDVVFSTSAHRYGAIRTHCERDRRIENCL